MILLQIQFKHRYLPNSVLERLLCARHCARHWTHKDEQDTGPIFQYFTI